jgi:predicted nucleotidyltransferase
MNNKFGISSKSFSLIIETLRQFEDIDSVKIFGSRALGTFKNGSDIDLAVIGKDLQESTAMNLSAELNESLPIPYFVDVVAPQNLTNRNLIDHIERAGVVFYEKL